MFFQLRKRQWWIFSLTSPWAVGSREMVDCNKSHNYTWCSKEDQKKRLIWWFSTHGSVGFIKAWETEDGRGGMGTGGHSQSPTSFCPAPTPGDAACRKPQNLKNAGTFFSHLEVVCLLFLEVGVSRTSLLKNKNFNISDFNVFLIGSTLILTDKQF